MTNFLYAMFVKASSSSVYQPQNHVLFAWFVVLGVSRGSLISLSICLYSCEEGYLRSSSYNYNSTEYIVLNILNNMV
jgi:hypothetical protein